MREYQPERLEVTAWNFGDAREIGMRPWGLQAGTWRLTVGSAEPREVQIERGRRVPLNLPATGEVEILLELVQAAEWSPNRPDLALSATEGARIADGRVTVVVHNIGSVEAPASVATLSRNGEVIAEAQVPAIAAPLDFQPKTAEVSFELPAEATGEMVVTLDAAGALPEITKLNNSLTVVVD